MDIRELAKQAGFEVLDNGRGGFIVEDVSDGSSLERFVNLVISKHYASQLAAQRKTETKKCDQCGTDFTGLVRKTTCNKCLNTAKKRRYRERLKNKNNKGK